MRHLPHLIRDAVGYGRRRTRSIPEHLRGAADWLVRAQRATPDDGVAHCYDVRARAWRASYPETTGYVIPTLYDYARHFGAAEFADAARRMAAWESDVQLADGGVRAGTMAAAIVVPTVFNTGQTLFGWARAFKETGDERFRTSLVRAADWLVAAQDPDGAWRRFPSPFTSAKLNPYNTRTGFGLVRAWETTGDARYLRAADASAAWALGRAHPNGWLPDNCLTENADGSALTHTIAYSVRGLLEIGVATGTTAYVDHARAMARDIARAQRPDGALPAYYQPDWTTRVRWTCVTGNSQMAINWLRLARVTGDPDLVEPARRANRFNMTVQDLDTADPNVRGGLKGSHPINGGYMTWRYPNWAAKFFMDGLMLEHLAGLDNVG